MRAFLKTTAAIGALLATPAMADPGITMSSDSGRPQLAVHVSGTGYLPGEKVDVFFDGAELRRTTADDTGDFARLRVKIPADAVPGSHIVSAVGRKDGGAAQTAFLVTTRWRQFGFDGNGGRFNRYENVLGASNASTLALVSKFDFGMATGKSDYTDAPIYAGSDLIFIGNSKGNLNAFGTDGTVKWTFNTADEIQTVPAALSGTGLVYVNSFDGNIYALNAQTGAQAWSVPIGSSSSNVTATADAVYAIGYSGGDCPLYALDAVTGTMLWNVSGLGQVVSSPAEVDGSVYVVAVDNMYAFDAKTGTRLWKTNFNGDVSSPAVVDGVVYVGDGAGKVHAVDAATGTELWVSTKLGDYMHGSPAVANGMVYFGTWKDTKQGWEYDFWALDAATGTEIWTAEVGSNIESSAVVANGVVYFGSNDEHVYAFDASNGTPLWNYQLTDQVRGSPIVADGMLIAASMDGKLWVFAPDGGDAVRNRKAARPSFSKLLPVSRGHHRK